MNKIVRLTESDLALLVKRVIKEQELEKRKKSQINEDIASNFNLGIDKFVTDPRVKKVLKGILDCALVQPTKPMDYLRALGNFIVLFLGEPSDSSDEAAERYGEDKEIRSKQFLKLINPCRSVTMEEIKTVMNHPEFKNFFINLKKMF